MFAKYPSFSLFSDTPKHTCPAAASFFDSAGGGGVCFYIKGGSGIAVISGDGISGSASFHDKADNEMGEMSPCLNP